VRCIACGENMVLLNVVPDRTMIVPGYERQTLQCSGCGESDHRLVFKSVQSPPVTSAGFESSQDNSGDTTAIMSEGMTERFRKLHATLRCLACGEEMALVEAVPDKNMIVGGYEHQTLRCCSCGEYECRLAFNPRAAGSGHRC